MSENKKVKAGPRSPRFLDIVDMPSDPNNSTGRLRNELVMQVAAARGHPEKVALLRDILAYTHKRIGQITKADEEEQKTRVEKRAAEAAATTDEPEE